MRRSLLLMSAGLLAASLIGFAGLNPFLPGGGDNAEYIAQAEALNTLGHRANLHLAGNPEDTFRPPLYPWMLAALMRLCGRNVVVFKAVNVLFALGTIAAVWWFLLAALRPDRKAAKPDAAGLALGDPRSASSPSDAEAESGRDARGPGILAATAAQDGQDARAPEKAWDPFQVAGWIAVWFALIPVLLYCAHDVLSDVPFAFLTTLALGCAARSERPRGAWWVLTSFALLVVAMLLRTAALFVAGALAGYFVIDLLLRIRQPERRRLAWPAVGFLVFTGALFFWSARGTQTYLSGNQLLRSYGSEGTSGAAQEIAGRVQRLGFFYGVSLAGEVSAHDVDCPYLPLPSLPESLVEAWGKWAHWPRMMLVGLAAGWGCVVLWRRRSHLIPIAFALHMGALLLWPFFDVRFFLPVLPLFLALVWVGGREILAGAFRRGLGVALATTAVLAVQPLACLLGALLALNDPRPALLTGLEWTVAAVLLVGLLIWLSTRGERATLDIRLTRLLAVLVLGVALVRSVDYNLARERQWGPALPVEGWPELHTAAKLIQENAAPDDVVVSAKTSLVWFWTGLKGVPVPVTTDPLVGVNAIAPARWAVIDTLPEDQVAGRYLLPLLESDREHWMLWRQVATRDDRGELTDRRTLIFRRRDKPKSLPVGRTLE